MGEDKVFCLVGVDEIECFGSLCLKEVEDRASFYIKRWGNVVLKAWGGEPCY